MGRSYKFGEARELGVKTADILDFIQNKWKRPLAIAKEPFYEWQFKQGPETIRDQKAFPAAVSHARKIGLHSDADMRDFFCMTHHVAHHFWQDGWFSTLDEDWVSIPHLYYPLELRSPPTTSIVLWSQDQMKSVRDRSRLYITKGDCDMDRPTQAYLDMHGWK